jgi:hypothetical protein
MDLTSLNPLEMAVYPYICHGYASGNLAKTLMPVTYSIARKLGRREKLILAYNREYLGTDELPLVECARIHDTVSVLRADRLRVLAEYHRQCLAILHDAPDANTPTQLSVGRVLGTPVSRRHVETIGRQLTGSAHFNALALVRLYDIAMLYREKMGGGGSLAEAEALSWEEMRIFLPMCRGLLTYEIAAWVGRSVVTVQKAIASIVKKLGRSRMELILAFTEAHCPDAYLPLGAFRAAQERLRNLTLPQARMLDEYVRQWQAYMEIDSRERAMQPTQESVGAALGIGASRIDQHFHLAAEVIGLSKAGKCHTYFKLVNLRFMAQMYLFMPQKP